MYAIAFLRPWLNHFPAGAAMAMEMTACGHWPQSVNVSR
ncbi:hypothetical protein SUDANB145_01166 [Streptomyces sp. enrichment culture]